MNCPKCQTANPEGKKFCRECGAKFTFACPQCAAQTLPGDKFCGECGQNIVLSPEQAPKGLSFDEKIDKIQRYLPEGLTKKILSQRDKIEGERKQVTVMFCDMEGFTGLSERLGPEEVYGIMDQVYEILIHKVHDYEGTVNEMTGDGIIALFGAPIALEDAPQRAIRSAYTIHREMTKLSDQLKHERGITPMRMRVGIHTGPVVVGTLGNDLRVEFKAVGDTVNLASRVEGLAEPGSTYVTEDTFKLTEGFFRFEALGEKAVKGKEELVRVYRVIAPSTRRTRFDVSAERGLTPFVGRERELELLLDGFERAKSGRGQAFSIMAEAGIGKSRLLYEFRKMVANEDLTFLEGKCLSYSRGIAYHPVIDILKSNFDVQEGDGDLKIRDRVAKGIKILGADETSTLPYLLELLSVKDSGIDQIPLSPEGRKDRISEALRQIILLGSEIRPLVMVIEDLHWIDMSSEDSFKDLLDSISGARVFLIFTYRPEFAHTWGRKSYHSQINLNRLSNRENLAMVAHLLGTEDIEQNLEELILEKAEGVPFFIEEFVISLKDLKVIKKTNGGYALAKEIQVVAIPSTVQDIIMARVDSLPEGARELLQTGAVIEREFDYGLIKRVTGLPGQELLTHLSILKDSELLYERGIFPRSTYIFKHALTQEVIYDSVLMNKKKRLHEEIGNAIEDIYQENIDVCYGVLAEHYIRGENYEKGAKYAKLAAANAEKAGSLTDAIPYAKKRLSSLEKLSRTDDVQNEIIDARTALGLHLLRILQYREAKEAIDPVIDLASKSAYKKRLAEILTIMGTYQMNIEEDAAKAFEHLEEAVNISEELKDEASLSLSSWRLGFNRALNCEFEKAIYHFQRALKIMRTVNNPWGMSATNSYLSIWGYWFPGKVDLACQTSDEAVRLAEESGDIYSKSMAYTSRGLSCYLKGQLDEAPKHFLRAIDLCEKIDYAIFNALARFFLGEIYYEIREYQASKEHHTRALRILEKHGCFSSWIALQKIGVAMAEVMMNEKDIELGPMYSYIHKNKLRLFEGFKLRYITDILLNLDDQYLTDAEDWIKRAIQTHRRDGMMWYLGRDYALYAELFKRKSKQSKARDNLDKAIEILEECGADGWVKKYEEELASLS
jgi:predicted ATPase/class 3 adenylate cyclase